MRTYALFLLVSACVISSCKVQREVTTQRDTVFITQRVEVTDTLLLRDTLTVTKDRLRIQIRRLPGDTVVIHGECQPDTVRLRQTIVNTNLKELEASRKWVGTLFIVALVLFILLLLKK